MKTLGESYVICRTGPLLHLQSALVATTQRCITRVIGTDHWSETVRIRMTAMSRGRTRPNLRRSANDRVRRLKTLAQRPLQGIIVTARLKF